MPIDLIRGHTKFESLEISATLKTQPVSPDFSKTGEMRSPGLTKKFQEIWI